jgi:hypothetical protein
MKGSEAADLIIRIVDEFGDAEVEIVDTYDMEMHQPATEVRYDSDRERIVVVSDR